MTLETDALAMIEGMRNTLPPKVDRDEVVKAISEITRTFLARISEMDGTVTKTRSAIDEIRHDLPRLRELLDERDTALALAADTLLSIHEHASSPAKVREYVSDGLEAIEEVTPLRVEAGEDEGSNVVQLRPRAAPPAPTGHSGGAA